MEQTPSPQHRPNLHLSLTSLLGNPNQPCRSAPGHTPYSTPQVNPFVAKTYSPFRSAGLKPPIPYGGSVQFFPRPKDNSFAYGNYAWFRFRRLCTSRTLVLIVVLIGLWWWWRAGLSNDLQLVKLGVNDFRLGTQIFEIEDTKDLQFFPAVNPKIHYIGRWTSTPNRLRKDGTFPGVYFDLNVFNTTTVLLSLHNAPSFESSSRSTILQGAPTTISSDIPNPSHLSFRHSPLLDRPAMPVSLLAQVDDDEYVLLPNSSSLVRVCWKDLDPNKQHQIRIIAPMTNDHDGVIQLEGIWMSKSGKLLRLKGSLLNEELEDEDALYAGSATIGEKHRAGLNAIMHNGDRKSYNAIKNTEDEETQIVVENRKKILEIITDASASLHGWNKGKRKGGADGLLAGVMGWEYLLGEMFGVDHVTIGVDGMCLVQDCIGGTGNPFGMGDVFFRSGPPHSAYFEHPWMFHGYIPDIMILNLGASDGISFEAHNSEYNKSGWDLAENFEDTYVSLVRGIRRLAYPKHPAILYSERIGSSGIVPTSTPASIPIFIMRPLRGQLEHATQGAVNRLRADGDNAVFWLDTSGWLSEFEDDSKVQDFYYDESLTPPAWRLTEQGNQRVAIFLHVHVCQYLASAVDHCAFLPPSVYQGKVFNPREANFDRYLENDKEKKLKELFWETRDESSPER